MGVVQARIQVYVYQPEGVDTKHGSVWISTLFDEVKIHLLDQNSSRELSSQNSTWRRSAACC